MQVYTEILPAAAKLLLPKISLLPSIHRFYLSGGTGLALQLGHRESEDFDFFIQADFDPRIIQQELETLGSLQSVSLDKGTLNTFVDSVKLQFLHYPYHLLESPIQWNNIQLSSVIDIACTKLVTISMRGSKKDFIDLYVILEHYSLNELFKKLEEKYQNVEYNHAHILKSLVYFADAEIQPMPKMHIPLAWNDIKATLTSKVKAVTF